VVRGAPTTQPPPWNHTSRRGQRAAGQRQRQVGDVDAIRIGLGRHAGDRFKARALRRRIFGQRQGAELRGKALEELENLRIDGHRGRRVTPGKFR
jgi:hypothetical protein